MRYTRTGGSWIHEYTGLSTDEKPVTNDIRKIPNGSTFLEMDTGDIYVYDLENATWRKLPNK